MFRLEGDHVTKHPDISPNTRLCMSEGVPEKRKIFGLNWSSTLSKVDCSYKISILTQVDEHVITWSSSE